MKRLIEREPITPFTDRVRGLAERGVSTILVIVSSDDNPDYKIPWLLFVLILPIAGFMLYFIFYSRKLQKRFIRRLNAMKERGYKKDDGALFERMREEDPTAFSQAKMLCRISDAHLFTDTKQTYFPLGENMHAAMLEDLARAEKFIYLEYYIIEGGRFWNSILDILKKKAVPA